MSCVAQINARTVWISDVHLGYKDCKAEYLLSFLNNIHCDTLYLVGDIVDLWSLKRRFFWPSSHYQVLLKLYQLAQSDMRVVYIPGNHDDPLRDFDGQKFGDIEVAMESEYVSVDGRRFLIMHGDAMDAYMNFGWLKKVFGDLAYDLLLFINRCSNTVRRWFGRPYFSLARLIKSTLTGARKAIVRYQNLVIAEAKHRGYDGVICGHIHAPALLNVDGFEYANTGDWIENCTALVESHSGQFELLHYSDRLEWGAFEESQVPATPAELAMAEALVCKAKITEYSAEQNKAA